jgi:hypothetical protein
MTASIDQGVPSSDVLILDVESWCESSELRIPRAWTDRMPDVTRESLYLACLTLSMNAKRDRLL